MTHRHPLIVLASMVAVLLFASALYLHSINAASFWEDESWMAIAIRGNLPGVWRFAAENGVHPPLYFLLAWGYARLAGDGELALRWFGGLWALVGIAVTYRLGAELYDRRAGAFAALLTAGSLFLLYWIRNARHYTLFFTLAVALAWAYVRWRRQPESRRWLGAVALLQAALLYTHYFGAWMAPVLTLHGLASMWLSGRSATVPLRSHIDLPNWLRLMGALVIISGLLFVPWLPSLLHQYQASPRGLGYAVTGANWALASYLDVVSNANYLLSILLLALGILATWRWRRWNAGLLLALWVVVPVALSLAVNTRFRWFVPRNLLFTLGAVSIFCGAGLSWIADSRPGRWAAVGAAIVFAIGGAVVYPTFYRDAPPNWREAARQIAEDARPGDLFVLRGEQYSLDYYLSRDFGQPVELTPFEDWMKHPATPDRIWLIDYEWAVRFEAIDALAPGMLLTRRPVVVPIVAELYQRPPADTLTAFGDTFALGSTTPLDEIALAPGKPVTLDLWWQVLRPPGFDYSTGVYLIAADGVVAAQNDGAFDRGRVNATALPLDRWTPDERTLALPVDLAPGEYSLLVSVYDWRDGKRLRPAGGRDDDLFVLAMIRVK